MGSHRLITLTSRSWIRVALASHMILMSRQPARLIALARQRFFTIPATLRSSSTTTLFSRTKRLASFWLVSLRISRCLASMRAIAFRNDSRRLDPFMALANLRLPLRIFLSKVRVSLALTFSPVLNVARVSSPRSTPTPWFLGSTLTGSTSTTKLRKYRPA